MQSLVFRDRRIYGPFGIFNARAGQWEFAGHLDHRVRLEATLGGA
jgi:hypothetical protein